MSFTVPVLALFQQPLSVTVTANSILPVFNFGGAAADTVRVKISLISELAIQKIAARSM
jgi:hypothetical protein